MSRLGILVMRLLAHLPLSWLRALGWLLGWVLYCVIVPRRRVVAVNLALCFPDWTPQRRARLARLTFIRIAQSWLDRSWLWHGAPEVTLRRLKVVGNLHALEGTRPTVIFAPHFVGMDAGWTALTQQVAREAAGIYTIQSNLVVDAWMLAGRIRFATARPFRRVDGVREIVSCLRRGTLLYLLPDMNFGVEESIFVPFYGVEAATLPSLARFAKLGRAQVVPMVTRMTPYGYEVQVLPAWSDFPSDDVVADTALMNRRLEGYIDAMPEQYYWVHKRFKSRPDGQQPPY